MTHQLQPEPTGLCWCGCGQGTKQGRYFVPGHDSSALWFVMKQKYGNTAAFLVAHGYGPGGKKARPE